MALTKAEKNALMERLLSGGLRRADVKLRERRDTGLTKLVDSSYVVTHEPTDSEFLFNGPISGARGWSGQKRVGTDPSTTWNAESWEQILTHAANWARSVADWARTPDLWDLDTEREASELMAAAQDDNTAFTAGEQAEITRRIDEVKQLVRDQFELTGEQLAVIDQRLDDAKEAAKTTSRKTWLYTFYGAVMSTLMTDEIPPHVVQSILATVVHGIGHLFGVGGPPPMITS